MVFIEGHFPALAQAHVDVSVTFSTDVITLAAFPGIGHPERTCGRRPRGIACEHEYTVSRLGGLGYCMANFHRVGRDLPVGRPN